MVKEFWRSVRIRRSYGKKSSGTFFFGTRCMLCANWVGAMGVYSNFFLRGRRQGQGICISRGFDERNQDFSRVVVEHSLWIVEGSVAFPSIGSGALPLKILLPCPPLDNIRVMAIVWRLRGKIVRTAPCWVVWHTVHSQQHTHVSSSYRSSRLGLSHWDPYAMRRGSCLELYHCNMVEWCWWDSGLVCKTNWFPSVLWHCWFGHMTCKNRPRYYL